MNGVITPEELMDQSDKGLLHIYQKTVTPKHITRAIKDVELWFTDRSSGCHGMLSRMCTALHTNNNLLHELHNPGGDKAVPLPVAAINRLSTAANKHKATAKNEQNRKAAERGAGSEAEICQPGVAQRVCEELIAYAEDCLDRLTTGGDKYMPEDLLPCVTVQAGIVGGIAAVLNAVTISSTMARKYAIVNARVGDIQVSQHVLWLQLRLRLRLPGVLQCKNATMLKW